MNIEQYRHLMTADLLMGPCSLTILKELFEKHPLTPYFGASVLDLGCGKGLTSLAIAKETVAAVSACDLWIAPEDNAKRFDAWGVGEQVTAVRADANELPFEKGEFSALISVDAYHYFATEKGFFEGKILPFLHDTAEVLIGIPGIKDEFAGSSEELLSAWLGDEAYMFQSPRTWKEIIGENGRIDILETWEMDCFDRAWGEWFATGHKYALSDREFFNTLIKPYTCFVGIYIKLK